MGTERQQAGRIAAVNERLPGPPWPEHGGMDALPPLETGTRLAALLVGGQRVEGELLRVCGRWLELADGATLRWLNGDHIVLIAAGAGALPDAAPSPRPKRGAAGAGTPWQDQDLRLLADALLDGIADGELAREFGRKPAEIAVLRRALTCLRGEVMEEDLDPAAASWVPRLRGIWNA